MTLVTPKSDGKRQRIIICTNRIEAQAMLAQKSAKFGLHSALMGLHQARMAIETETDMTAEQKAEALKGIDSAIAEVEKEAGKDD